LIFICLSLITDDAHTYIYNEYLNDREREKKKIREEKFDHGENERKIMFV
jgi:hypothetical protein